MSPFAEFLQTKLAREDWPWNPWSLPVAVAARPSAFAIPRLPAAGSARGAGRILRPIMITPDARNFPSQRARRVQHPRIELLTIDLVSRILTWLKTGPSRG
jgi:hypothetical protein